MPCSVDDGLVKVQARLTSKKPELFHAEHQESEQRPAQESQERLRARLFRRNVEAAAVATCKPTATPVYQQQHPLTPTNTEQRNAMAGDLSLDSLIMKILARIPPPANLTKDLRDLVGMLPAAVHAERAVHEAKINELTKKVNQRKSTTKDIDSATAKEINNIKSVEGGLKYDITQLENLLGKATCDKAAGEARNVLQRLKCHSSTLKGDITRLEQNLKGGNAPATLSYVPTGLTRPTATSTSTNSECSPSLLHPRLTRLISDNMQDPREPPAVLTSYPLPIANLPTRSQLSARSPPQDPRPQLYAPSSSGFLSESSRANDAPRIFQGNEKQTIHPSRLGHLDERSVSKVLDSALPGRTVAALAMNKTTSPQFNGPQRTGQTAAQSTGDSSTIQPIDRSTVGALANTDTAKRSLNGFFKSKQEYDPQQVPSTETREAQGLSTHDPRLVDRMNAIFDRKRAAPPTIEHEAAKRVKVEIPGEEEVCTPQEASVQMSKPNGEPMQKRDDSTSLTSISEDELEELEAQYVEAKRRHTTPLAETGDTNMEKPISDTVAEQTGAAVAGQSPNQQERRDSAVGAPAAPVASLSLSDRQPICARCRFAKLACDHKKPCTNCAAHKNDCVYWSCEYGMDCTSATCWFSHKPAAEALSEPEQLLDSTAVGEASAAA